MKILMRAVFVCLTGMLPVTAQAAIACVVSDFQVEVYDHAGTYIHGKVHGGAVVAFINICGKTSGVQDCSGRATDRRLAIALAAQAQGKTLLAYFDQFNSCAEVQPYAIVTGLRTWD